MKHRLLIAAAAAALLAPSVAAAQDSGVYLRGQLGYGVFGDSELTIDADNSAESIPVAGIDGLTDGQNALVGDVAGGGDLAYSLGVGYDFGSGWRLEADTSSFFNDFGTIGGAAETFAKMRLNTLTANLLYDFSDFGRFEPYVGGGIGISQGNVSAIANDFINPSIAGQPVRNPACVSANVPNDQFRTCRIDDEDTNFAWNLQVGLGYEITPNLHWDTNYRYYDLGTYDLNGVAETINVGGGPGSSATLESELEDASAHMLMTGFRYRFGDTPPPPPPVIVVEPDPLFVCWDGTEVTDAALCPPEPAPEPTTFICEGSNQVVTDLALCPPRNECPDGSIVYGPVEFCPSRGDITGICDQEFRQEIIYYEFDRGQSAETRNTINRILDIGDFCQVDNIRVVGHTDTSGSAAYNLRLSQRRAQDALNELVRQGIDRAIITSEGKGETEPFVQTGDGVREQLNRRTEVLIQLSDVGFRDMSSGN